MIEQEVLRLRRDVDRITRILYTIPAFDIIDRSGPFLFPFRLRLQNVRHPRIVLGNVWYGPNPDEISNPRVPSWKHVGDREIEVMAFSPYATNDDRIQRYLVVGDY